jgi:hypothetical protein
VVIAAIDAAAAPRQNPLRASGRDMRAQRNKRARAALRIFGETRLRKVFYLSSYRSHRAVYYTF